MAENSSVKTRIHALIGLSLVGFAISVYQSTMFYQLRSGEMGFRSGCNMGPHANCDAITASRYAELFWGIPLSSAAAGWFLALFTIGFFAKNAFWRRDALRFALGMTAFSATLSLAYLGIMLGVLHTFCIYCLAVDAVNWISLGLVLSLASEWRSAIPYELSKIKTLAGLTAGALLVSGGLLKTLDAVQVSGGAMNERISQVLSSPVLAVDAGDTHPSFGPKDAPVTIVEFSDFQCPYCKVGAVFLNTVLNRYPDKVRVVFRAYPLDPSCNSSVQHAMHPVACDAARTAYCAWKQGKFKEVYEHFFEHQTEFSTVGDGLPASMAAKAGMDSAALGSCTGMPEIQNAIAKDIEEGNHLGVQSTPTFFVNGHKVEGVYPIPAWNALVDRILADQAAGGK